MNSQPHGFLLLKIEIVKRQKILKYKNASAPYVRLNTMLDSTQEFGYKLFSQTKSCFSRRRAFVSVRQVSACHESHHEWKCL